MGRKLEKPLLPVLERMALALNAEGLPGIAAALEQPITTVRNWHTRGNVPTPWVIKVAELSGRSLGWLLVGDAEQPNMGFLGQKGLLVKKSVTTDAFGQGSEVTEKANLFAKSAAGDAYGVYPPRENLQHGVAAKEDRPAHGPRAWNAELMRTVLRVVTEQLRAKGLELPADKLAELVVLIYEHVADESVPIDQVEGTTQRYLRLVA